MFIVYLYLSRGIQVCSVFKKTLHLRRVIDVKTLSIVDAVVSSATDRRSKPIIRFSSDLCGLRDIGENLLNPVCLSNFAHSYGKSWLRLIRNLSILVINFLDVSCDVYFDEFQYRIDIVSIVGNIFCTVANTSYPV